MIMKRCFVLLLALVGLVAGPVLLAAESVFDIVNWADAGAAADAHANLRVKAESGDVDAQRNLGTSYYDGTGVRKDGNQAVKWFRKAAEQGDLISMEMLASIYWNGDLVPKDGVKAVYWGTKAAKLGD